MSTAIPVVLCLAVALQFQEVKHWCSNLPLIESVNQDTLAEELIEHSCARLGNLW